MVKTKNTGPRKPRNREVAKGVMFFSKSQVYRKRALYKKKKTAPPKEQKPAPPKTKEPRSYPTQSVVRPKPKRAHKLYKNHVRRLRSSITPGTVLIPLSGIHRGRRIVFLKHLASGMLLCTGPYKLNGVPLRRFNQTFVLATKTKLDVSKVKLPDNLNDDFFKRQKQTKKSDSPDQLFQSEKVVFKPNEERKEAQKLVDKQIAAIVKAHPDKNLMRQYLSSLFSLSKKDCPHKMLF